MNKNIEVIEDNAGGITIQNTETKDVAHFIDHWAAEGDLKGILDGDDMSGWELSDPDCYITDEDYNKAKSSGGLKLLDEADIRELLAGE